MCVMFFHLVTNVMPQTGIDYVTCNKANLDNLQDLTKTLIFSFKTFQTLPNWEILQTLRLYVIKLMKFQLKCEWKQL